MKQFVFILLKKCLMWPRRLFGSRNSRKRAELARLLQNHGNQ